QCRGRECPQVRTGRGNRCAADPRWYLQPQTQTLPPGCPGRSAAGKSQYPGAVPKSIAGKSPACQQSTVPLAAEAGDQAAVCRGKTNGQNRKDGKKCFRQSGE